MKHIYQPEGSKSCGQHCVAMIAGISVEESIAAFGHDKGTRRKAVIEVLKKLGLNPGKKAYRFILQKQLPELCMLIIKWDKKGSHWVVYNNGKIYCPLYGVFDYSKQNIADKGGEALMYLKIGKNDKTP